MVNIASPRVFLPPFGYVPARDRNFSKLGKVLGPPVPFHSSAQADPGSRTVLVPASGHPQAREGSQELAQANPGPQKAVGLTGLQKSWQGRRRQGAVKWACEVGSSQDTWGLLSVIAPTFSGPPQRV